METIASTVTNWRELTHDLGKVFEQRADQNDREASFVFQNYEDLKANRFFSLLVPEELGGAGVSHTEVCQIVRELGRYCGSTALAFSMHQHLVAAAVWRYRTRGESGPLLQKVAANQLVLVSTGARDWLESNGEMVRTEGGYLLTAKKQFASQSAAGDIAVTSAPYQHPSEGWQVLHFAVPLTSEGVSLLDDWDVMGMRGTGSQTISFKNVFVPDSAIVLARARSGFHPVWDVVLTVAMPLIMAAYVGIAEKAQMIALELGKNYWRNQKHLPYITGKMYNTLLAVQTQWKEMCSLTNNINFKPSENITVDMLSLKTNVANGCIQLAHEAMESVGGQSFYRKNHLERLFRDLQGAQFHPLPLWEQYYFTGERLLTREP